MGGCAWCARTALGLSLLAATGCVHRTKTRWHPEANQGCADHACFRVGRLDGDWRLVVQEEGAFGFYSPSLGGVVQAKATCRDMAEATPLSSLTNQLLVGYTDRRVVSIERTTIADREALHSIVDARLDGVPVRLDIYVLKRNGCIFDLSYAAPPSRYAAGRPAFARFVSGFVDERSPS